MPAHHLLEVAAAFLKLGCISFGGPVAHLGYFREEFVAKRHWLNDAQYVDIVALCQFLPGPASSQVVFALGMMRAGLLGAVTAAICFLLPSAIIMIACGYGLSHVADLQHAGWLHSLKLAAVVVVAQAVWSMGRNLCPDRTRLTLCLACAAAVLLLPGTLTQVGVIAVGAVVGWMGYRHYPVPRAERVESSPRAKLAGVVSLATFGALLLLLPVAASVTGERSIGVFDSFYRSGALVFGGGHVVLPLLREELVPKGWITDDAFLAGYAAAQAVPGPLFTFAAYLGTVIHAGPGAWLGGVWALLALFLPGWLLIGGMLPFWHQIRPKAWAQAALKGASAAVVGVLLAALVTPVAREGITSLRDVAAVLIGFALVNAWKLPAWAFVLLMAAAGQWLLAMK